MARVGSFTGPAENYGIPLSVVLPPDNGYAKAKYDEALLDPKLKLTQQQRDDLQAQIDGLFSLLKIAQGLPK